MRSLAAGLAAIFAAQRDRWILWLPVAAIAGAAAWLLAPVDPPWWWSLAASMAGIALACALALLPSRLGLVWRLRQIAAGVAAMIACAGVGAAAAQVRTALLVEPPFIASTDAVEVQGWVVEAEPGQTSPRLRLLVRSVEGIAHPPRYARLSVPALALLTPGRSAICRGEVAPPAGPIAPGGYDFARRAFFDRLGASGFACGRCRPGDFGPPPSPWDRFTLKIAAMRSDLSLVIQEAAPGRGGAIAAALVTGDRSGVDEGTNDALRNSGLGHLLSVSGVHMSIVGGLSFAALLGFLSLIPPLALRLPVKKLAAAGALIVLGLYLIASGFSVPALRSYVMAGVAFGAILLDRPAISMRGLALAAFITVLLFPDSVLEPGFQMSFAATLALVALFEIMRRSPAENALPAPGLLIGSLQWSARAIGGVMLISLVAGLATDPFAIYHFQRFSIYSLATNLAVEPIISFLVAPAAGAAAVLAPFGWSDWPLKVMSSALDLVAAIAHAFGDRPEAVRALPRPPDAAFLLWVGALLWGSLWRGNVRWGGALLFAAGVALYVIAPRPVAAFDGDLRVVFAQTATAPGDHWTLAAKRGRSTYARDHLGGMLGLSPSRLETLAAPEGCSETLCVWRAPRGHEIALVRDATALASACRPHVVLLGSVAVPADFRQRCGARTIIDHANLAQQGGALIYETPTGFMITRAQPPNIRRAWTPRGAAADD